MRPDARVNGQERIRFILADRADSTPFAYTVTASSTAGSPTPSRVCSRWTPMRANHPVGGVRHRHGPGGSQHTDSQRDDPSPSTRASVAPGERADGCDHHRSPTTGRHRAVVTETLPTGFAYIDQQPHGTARCGPTPMRVSGQEVRFVAGGQHRFNSVRLHGHCLQHGGKSHSFSGMLTVDSGAGQPPRGRRRHRHG